MNAIIGLTELVLDTDLKSLQRQYMDTVLNSANSLLSLINGILDFSKIEAGKLELERIDFDLRELVENICDPLSIAAHKKGLELSSRIKPGVPIKVIGDPGRLGQILLNLLGNALKFTTQGEIVLEVDTQQGSSADKPPMLHFAISDTGIGIPASKFDKIFENFSQVDGSTTRKYGGTGLGLAISKRLVCLMGGKVWLQSTEGEGTTFHFTAAISPSAKAGKSETCDFTNIKVLIACNYSTAAAIIKDILWGRDNELDEAIGAEETIKKLEAARLCGRPYDVIFIDVRLSANGGFKMAEYIIDSDIPSSVVMMLNSNQRSGDTDRCEELGVFCHVTKPIKRRDIINSITKALYSKQSGSAPGQKEQMRQEPVQAAGTPVHILLVEDNSVNRVVATEILKKYGFKVTEAADGQMAVAQVREVMFDLILMDIQMPVMDGLEAAKIIKSSAATRNIPIIAMTAHALKGDRERCLAAGMDDYLTKPIRAKELIQTIAKYTGTEIPETKPITQIMPAQADKALTPPDNTEANMPAVQDIMKQIFNSKLPKLLETIPPGHTREFVEKSASTIASMMNALSSGNYPATERFAEAIKDAAEMLPQAEIKAAAFRMMLSLRKSDVETANIHFKRLAGELDKFINQMLGASPS